MRTILDERDSEILRERVTARRVRDLNGPLVGDYVSFPDGHYERVSYDWGDSLQTSEGGSFYLHSNGEADFSGGLNPGIKMEHFSLTEARRDGRFWFFHHDMPKADNGVDVTFLCRVYRCDINREWRIGAI